MNIRIFGYGRLAQALIELWKTKHQITVSAPSLSTIRQGNLKTNPSNLADLTEQDCYILALKPKNIFTVLEEIAPKICNNRPIISLAAGITLNQLQSKLPNHPLIIRAMPNIAGEIGQSATVMMPEQHQNLEKIQELFLELGSVTWVDNDDILDLATILTGSGPAYVFYFMQAFSQAIETLGMPSALSEKLVKQTFLGAASLSLKSPMSLEALQAKVTSPQGTTAAALEVFEKQEIKKSLSQALNAAWQRITELRR